MGKGFVIALSLVALGTVAPIWRGAGHSRVDGVSFWTLLSDSTRLTLDSPFGHPHLPYAEAQRRAQEAYQALNGGVL